MEPIKARKIRLERLRTGKCSRCGSILTKEDRGDKNFKSCGVCRILMKQYSLKNYEKRKRKQNEN